MKKRILISLIALAVIGSPRVSSAQAFQNGDNLLGVGIGFGSSLYSDLTYSASPVFSVQFEHGMWDIGGPGVISLGGYLGYRSFSETYTYWNGYYGYYGLPTYATATYSWSDFFIGARGAYHYNGLSNKQLDLYGGIMISFDIVSGNNIEGGVINPLGSSLEVTPFVGARYFFSDKFAAYGELGYGIAFFSIGAAVKF